MRNIAIFVKENSEKLAAFQDAVAGIQADHREAVLRAESLYAENVSKPITRWSKRNDSYWSKWGPTIVSHLRDQIESEQRDILMQKIEAFDRHFTSMMQSVERRFFPEGVKI